MLVLWRRSACADFGDVYESERVCWEDAEEAEDGAQTTERAREQQSNGTAEECEYLTVRAAPFLARRERSAVREQPSER